MRRLFSRYTIFFLVFCALIGISDLWSAPPIGTDTVVIYKAGIKKLDYTSGNLDYMGENVNADAADGDTDWTIYKFTWDGTNCTVIQKRTGSWTGRAALFA